MALLELQAAPARARVVAPHVGERIVLVLDVGLRFRRRGLGRRTRRLLGATGSLLLGDGVVNQTIPLILCGEEDVEGNHGATIGRLDEKMLFYLASRGIPEEAARSLLARARIEAVVDLLPEALAEEAHKFMEAHTDEL